MDAEGQPTKNTHNDKGRDTLPLYSHLIRNEWVDSAGLPLPVTAPATGRRFAWLGGGGATEIDAAVRAALTGDWGRTTALPRGIDFRARGFEPSEAPGLGHSQASLTVLPKIELLRGATGAIIQPEPRGASRLQPSPTLLTTRRGRR